MNEKYTPLRVQPDQERYDDPERDKQDDEDTRNEYIHGPFQKGVCQVFFFFLEIKYREVLYKFYIRIVGDNPEKVRGYPEAYR